MTWLLDGNILAAHCLEGHVHYALAQRWLNDLEDNFATCSVTEGTLLRLHMSMAVDGSAAAAWATLAGIRKHPRHVFWDVGFSYADVSPRHLLGAKQVTDAWLAQVCRQKKGKLATLDAGLARLHPDVAHHVRSP